MVKVINVILQEAVILEKEVKKRCTSLVLPKLPCDFIRSCYMSNVNDTFQKQWLINRLL